MGTIKKALFPPITSSLLTQKEISPDFEKLTDSLLSRVNVESVQALLLLFLETVELHEG